MIRCLFAASDRCSNGHLSHLSAKTVIAPTLPHYPSSWQESAASLANFIPCHHGLILIGVQGHVRCVAGPSRLFPSPSPLLHNRAVAPTHQTLLPSLISRPTAVVGLCKKSISRFIPDFQIRYLDLGKIRY